MEKNYPIGYLTSSRTFLGAADARDPMPAPQRRPILVVREVRPTVPVLRSVTSRPRQVISFVIVLGATLAPIAGLLVSILS